MEKPRDAAVRVHDDGTNSGMVGKELSSELIGGQLLDQKAFFRLGATRDVVFRKNGLKRLKRGVSDNYDPIVDALYRDLRKPEYETYITEIAFFFQEVDHAISRLKKWAEPRGVRNPWLLWPATSSVVPEPLGTTLIIGPWNYPFQLTMAPLVASIAAGNTAVIKPSEVAPHTSKIIHKIIRETFDPEYVAVVEGGVETTQTLLRQRFDKIFFTGGPVVGKIVMEAAAHNLTPVTLELGGKSPVIVARDASFRATARKVAWGKFLNAGQTCLAPDYVLVQNDVKETFLGELTRALREFYGNDPRVSPDYARIINRKHYDRVLGLVGDAEILIGGRSSPDELYIEPTVLDLKSSDARVMEEEIFGPLLPVIGFSEIDEAISFVRDRPKPLALYLFTNNRKTERQVLEGTSSGGMVINDTVVHVANSHLPFGGVGASGLGAYHGKRGFDEFSHLKSVVKRRFHFDVLFRYPPYNIPLGWLRKILG